MKKIQSLALILLAAFTMAVAQEKKEMHETKVSKMSAGASLTKDDVNFLGLVSGADASKSRGDGVSEAKLGGKTFKAGQKLTQEDVDAIAKASKAYTTTNKQTVTKDKKGPGQVRGCYYYCYYWYDGYYYWYCC